MVLLLVGCLIETAISPGSPAPGAGSDGGSDTRPADTGSSTPPLEDPADTGVPSDTSPVEDTAVPDDTAADGDTAVSDDPCDARRCADLPTVTDQDGNTYGTVQIGAQCWMASNLRAASYRNGDPIATAWGSGRPDIGYQAAYDDDASNEPVLGKLYNGHAVLDARGLCPAGWRVPSSADFDVLVQGLDPLALAGADVFNGTTSPTAGGALKATTGWDSPNAGATNSSCFGGAASGYRGTDGRYYNKGLGGYFWTTTDAFGGGYVSLLDRRLWNFSAEVVVAPNVGELGFPVRCVRE